MQAVMDSENQSGIEEMLHILKREEPDACSQTQLIMSDLAKSFYNAWRSVIGEKARHSTCSWHVERAWEKNIKNSSLLSHVKDLRVVTKEEEFIMKLNKLDAE